MKKEMRKLIVTLMAALLIFTTVGTTAQAGETFYVVEEATYQVGNYTLQINADGSTLSIAGVSTPIKLTKRYVLRDAGIDPTTGTVYLWWRSNSLYAYNYELQKSSSEVNLFLVAKDVTSIVPNRSGTFQGYTLDTNAEKVIAPLTLAEIKAKLGISSEDSKGGNDSSDGNNGGGTNEENNGGNSDSNSGGNDSSNSNSDNNSGGSTSDNSSKSTTVKDGPSIVKGKVVYSVTKNGKTVTYTMTAKNVDSYGVDKNKTVWVKGKKGCLYLWNYSLQKNASKIKMIRVTKTKCTGLAFKKGKVVGYYLAGSTKMQKIWSKSKIKKKLAASNTAKKSTKKVTTTKKNYVVVTYQYRHKLMLNGKKIDSFWGKGTTMKYHGVKYGSVQIAAFNEKGNVLVISVDHRLISINRKTMKLYLKGEQISHFNYTKWGTVRWAVKQDGTRIKVNKY